MRSGVVKLEKEAEKYENLYFLVANILGA